MGTDQVIYIRTDGNTEIATGHIMRCLTIANACQKKGAKVVFIVADAESEALLGARIHDSITDGNPMDTPFPIINLCTDYHDAEEELPILCQVLMSYPCTTLLIDSYFVNPGYLETLSRLTHVAYIDDLYSFPYPVQTVINYDINPNPAADCYRLASKKLLGLAYTPLREMFEQCSYTVRPQIQKILLMAGGMDNGGYFTGLIRALSEHFCLEPYCSKRGCSQHKYAEQKSSCASSGVPASDIPSEASVSADSSNASAALSNASTVPDIHVLTGSADIAPELSALMESHPDIVLQEYVTDMADFLCEFDLILTASGTTLYEICALGIPCISFVIADNQIPSATAFDLNNLVPCLGDLRIEGPYTEIIDKLLTAYEDYETRCICSERMKNAIDKKGADRIADALLI